MIQKSFIQTIQTMFIIVAVVQYLNLNKNIYVISVSFVRFVHYSLYAIWWIIVITTGLGMRQSQIQISTNTSNWSVNAYCTFGSAVCIIKRWWAEIAQMELWILKRKQRVQTKWNDIRFITIHWIWKRDTIIIRNKIEKSCELNWIFQWMKL